MAWKKTNEMTELTATGLTTIRAIVCPIDLVEDNGGGCAGSQAPAPTPVRGGPTPTQVINRSFSTVGEFGYGIDTSAAGLPTFKFWDSRTTPPFQFAPVLDFFSYNPVSSAYPRAGIVNLYTRNAPVIAAMLKSALKNEHADIPPCYGCRFSDGSQPRSERNRYCDAKRPRWNRQPTCTANRFNTSHCRSTC